MENKTSKSSFGVVASALLIGVLVWFGFLFYRWILNNNLNEAAAKGDLNRVTVLLAQGVDIEGRSLHYKTPLMSAAENGHKDVALYLIRKGANINAHNNTVSVLMCAITPDNTDLIQILIKHGADVNWHSRNGSANALTIARQLGNAKAIKLLKDEGAS